MTSQPGKAGRPRRRAVVTAIVVVLVSASALALFWSRRAARVPAPAPSAVVGPAVVGPGPAVPEPAPAPLPDPRPRFQEARAVVTCGQASGSVTGEAVFVAPDRALASVECPDGAAQLRLGDGRELLARSREGAPPGTAVLDVPGADAPFLAPGSAVALGDGEGLLVALEGAGAGTIAEATSRGLVPTDGRPMLVVAEAAAPIAGPVADLRGALVAVVPAQVHDPARALDPARPGLAVPIEAFASHLGRAVTPAWEAATVRAVDEERRAAADLWNALARSAVLLSAGDRGGGSLALVAGRVSAGRPPAEVVRLVVAPSAPACDLFGRITEWRTGPRALDGVALPPGLRARLLRLPAPATGMKLWVGAGTGRVACEESAVPEGAVLAVLGSDPPAAVAYPRPADPGKGDRPGGTRLPALPPRPGASAPADDGEAREAAARAEAAERDAEWELGWRQAFREANDRVARAAQRRRDLQAQRDEARGRFQPVLEQQLEDDLEAGKLEERLAAEALEELERRASLDAVPRAWRRP